MSYYDNPYTKPSKFGLEIIAELDEPNLSYEFNMICFWKKDGIVYAAQDSGCSCPSPFEDLSGIEELERIPNIQAARDFVSGYNRFAPDEVASAMELIEEVFNSERKIF